MNKKFRYKKNRLKTFPYFDEYFYLKNNPDIEASEIRAIDHFFAVGQLEKRDPSAFIHIPWLIWKYSKNQNDFINLSQLADNNSQNISLNCLFDPIDYLNEIGKETRLDSLDSFTHYMKFGIHEGINPNSWFELDKNRLINSLFLNWNFSRREFFELVLKKINSDSDVFQELIFIVRDKNLKYFQIDSNVVNGLIQKNRFLKNDQTILNWSVIDLLAKDSKNNFAQLKSVSTVANYPPSIEATYVNPDRKLNPRNKFVFYCHWDANDYFASWIQYSLNWYKEHGFGIVLNTNSKIEAIPINIKEKCDFIIKRTNSGIDFESHLLTYRYLLESKVEMNTVILTNDSIFFPTSNTKKIEEFLLDSKKTIWSMTRNLKPVPHLQSYFLVISEGELDRFMKWLEEKLIKWEYIGKSGAIFDIEINIENELTDNITFPEAIYTAETPHNPTHFEWTNFPKNNVPVMKVEKVRHLLAGPNALDPELLKLKLEKVFSESPIKVEKMLDFARYVEISRNDRKIW